MLADLEYLASDSLEGRAAGTAGGRAARQFVTQALRDAGVPPLGPEYVVPFRFSNRGSVEVEGANVIGVIRGTEYPEHYIVLSAHYDHLGIRNGHIMNGADDNASGTAAVLALARVFVQQPIRHSLLVTLFDAEEQGLQGSRAFAAHPPVPFDSIVLDINLDMVSHSDSVLYVAGTHYTPSLRPILEAVPVKAPVVFRFGHDSPDLGDHDDWTNASDHAAFHQAGVPFVYFGVEDHPDYHQPTDDADTINRVFYGRAIEAIRQAVIDLDSALDTVTVGAPGGSGA